MREVISLSTGQAGVQIGNTCWELYCLEHGLDEKGFVVEKKNNAEYFEKLSEFDMVKIKPERCKDLNRYNRSAEVLVGNEPTSHIEDGFESFYMEMSNGNFSPRNIMIDLEPTVVDVIRTGPYRDLYPSYSMISSNEDAANNYARGYYTSGTRLLRKVVESIRRMAEGCDRLQGFMSFHSVGGGTGSGFHASLSDQLCQIYPKLSKLEVSIIPSPKLSTAVVEPYNAALITHHTLSNTECCIFLADNEALYNICQKKLNIDNPTYTTLNRLLAQTVSSVTASLRFKGTLNADFSDFQTNLVPYPRIHFPVVSYAPIVNSKTIAHEPLSAYDITSRCFDCSNRLVRCENESGLYISCCLLYRGDITPKDINSAIALIKKKKDVHFVPWSPTGFKVGINCREPAVDLDGNMSGATKACCMLSNNTAIKETWASLNIKFHVMLRKKAFLDWYIREGMEEEEFYIAQDDLLCLEQDYVCLSE